MEGVSAKSTAVRRRTVVRELRWLGGNAVRKDAIKSNK